MKSIKNDHLHLVTIKELIDEIECFKKDDVSKLIFDKASRMNLALIGESVNQLSPQLLNQYPGVPWRSMIALRNRIIHDYAGLDGNVIDEILMHRLDDLKKAVVEMLAKLPRS